MLVDVGPTALMGFARAGLSCEPVDRLFLTHLHGYHTAGWPFLLLQLGLLHDRSRRFVVHGPPGSRECLEGLERCCYPDLADRRRFEIEFEEIPVARGRGRAEPGGPSYEVFPMRHHPSSIGLSFGAPGARIGVSGDTAWGPELVGLAAESDLLVLECSSVAPLASPGHVSLAELRERRNELACDRVVLVHLPDAVSVTLAREPIPGVSAAFDGMSLGSY